MIPRVGFRYWDWRTVLPKVLGIPRPLKCTSIKGLVVTIWWLWREGSCQQYGPQKLIVNLKPPYISLLSLPSTSPKSTSYNMIVVDGSRLDQQCLRELQTWHDRSFKNQGHLYGPKATGPPTHKHPQQRPLRNSHLFLRMAVSRAAGPRRPRLRERIVGASRIPNIMVLHSSCRCSTAHLNNTQNYV